MDNSILGVWGALTVVALVSSAVSIWLTLRAGSVSHLVTQVRELGIQVEELYEAVDRWTRRKNVAEARLRRSEIVGATQVAQPGTPEYKSMLRQKARGRVIQ